MYSVLEQLVKSKEGILSLVNLENEEIDVYIPLVTELYTGPMKKSTRVTPDFPVQTIIDLPELNVQLHIHGPDENTYTHGHLVGYNQEKIGRSLNGMECAFAEFDALNIKLKKITKS